MVELHDRDTAELPSPSASARRPRISLNVTRLLNPERVVITGALWILAALMTAPLLLVVVAAFSPGGTLNGGIRLPSRLTFANMERAWRVGDFASSLRSSLIVTISVVIMVAVLSVLAGYALAVLRPIGTRAFVSLFLLGLIIPFEALIIPLYYNLRTVGLTDTYWSLILPQSALSLSFGIYWMRSFFRNVPPSVLEAAEIDGASSTRTLWAILIPMGWPAILTMVILTFMWNWNEFLLPLIMILTPSRQTGPLSLAMFQGQHLVDISGQAAGSILIAAPVVLLYLLLQRRVIGGLTQASFRRQAPGGRTGVAAREQA